MAANNANVQATAVPLSYNKGEEAPAYQAQQIPTMQPMPMPMQMPAPQPQPQPVMMYQNGQQVYAYPPSQVMMPAQPQPQAGQVMYYMANGGQMTPVVMMNPGQMQQQGSIITVPHGDRTDQYRGCTKTSMKCMRALQLAFSLSLITCLSGMLAFTYYNTFINDIWTFFVPLASTIMAIVQLSNYNNHVNPGCTDNSPQCRSASDLTFAILYTIQTGLLASIVWMLVYVSYTGVAGFLTFLGFANAASFILCVLYWITYSNIMGCCYYCINNY